VAGGVLHVFEWHTGLSGASDEGNPERVRSYPVDAIEAARLTSRRTMYQALGAGYDGTVRVWDLTGVDQPCPFTG
jgi:hypothetical protein